MLDVRLFAWMLIGAELGIAAVVIFVLCLT
jgi:hypothetical protein